MKRISFTLSFLLFTMLGIAENLKFMGTPMGCNIQNFTEQIRQRYPLQKKVGGDNYYIFKGNVYGHDSYLKAEYSRKTKIVYKITVTPKQIDQNALADSIVSHYGMPLEVKGGYRWNVIGGTIFLYTPEGYDPVLMYFDTKGVETFKKEQ